MRYSVLAALILVTGLTAAPVKGPSKKEALQPLQDLVGEWKGTGTPQGVSVRDREFWQETIAWQWQFKGENAWLRADLEKSKHFTRLEVRPGAEKGHYELKAWTPEKKELTFSGKLEKRRLTFDRLDATTKETHRLILSLLHSNRYLYSFEVRKPDTVTFQKRYQVGATKKGVPFASESRGPECVVSGGLGTTQVTHKGKTYYVCCSGCRDAFRDEPDKYVREYEESLKKKKD